MWLYAMNLVIISRKGISALQLKRELGMGSYQSAWRMLHQIRKAMEKEEYKETFEAIVEIDETYVGGKATRLCPFWPNRIAPFGYNMTDPFGQNSIDHLAHLLL